MLKCIVWMLMVSWASVCVAHDENYYMMNPKKIQKVLADCPQRRPDGVSCEQLNQIAAHMNELAAELRQDPQAYGHYILSMQETIAQQIALSNQQKDSADLQAQLAKNQQTLRERLTIIKWLESPDAP